MHPRIKEILEKDVEVDGVKTKVRDLETKDLIDLLLEQAPAEFCSKENQYFRLEKLYYITDKNSKKVLFKMNRAQRHFYENVILKGYKRIIVLKSRQLGFSTFIALMYLDFVIFNPSSTSTMVAHALKDASKIYNTKIKFAYNNLNAGVKGLFSMNSNQARMMEFGYSDGQISIIDTGTSTRSSTVNYLHISEWGKLSKQYPDRAQEVVTGSINSVPTDGMIIIESTAEGQLPGFYEMFMKSWKMKSDITPTLSKAIFYPVFYNWQWDDEELNKAGVDGLIPVSNMTNDGDIIWEKYQKDYELTDKEINFYYVKYNQMGQNQNQLFQEYPTDPMSAFLATGAPWFPSLRTSKMYDLCNKNDWRRYSLANNELIEDPLGPLHIRHDPKRGKKYVIGADVGGGKETSDASTFFVMGLDREIKAYFQAQIETDDFCDYLYAVGKLYNSALLAPEANKDGNWIGSYMAKKEYPNLYFRHSFDNITKTKTDEFGWYTNTNTRNYALKAGRLHFLKNVVVVKELLEEMMTFTLSKRKKYEAAPGKNDDLVLAYCITCAVLEEMGKDMKDDEVSESNKLIEYLFS